MCGRYTIRKINLVKGLFGEYVPEFDDLKTPRFNISPGMQIPLVRINSKGEQVLGLASWGLVPSWVRGKPKSKPINARAETVASSGMFKQAFERRRCLIPADGFYEWQGKTPPKQPFFIHKKDDGVFAFAGLWERNQSSPDAEPVDSCTIITTTPNELMKQIHERMPVILDEADYGRWLDRKVSGADVLELLRPFGGELDAWKISQRVNKVGNDGPELIEPV